jgi:hypothetical protein
MYRTFSRNNTLTLARVLVHLGAHDEAAATADRAAQSDVEPAADLYNAACIFSLCVPVADKDSKLTEVERQKLAHDYADRAMALLREAVAKGYRDAQHLAKDDDLAPLSKRPDYQALLKEMEKARPASK